MISIMVMQLSAQRQPQWSARNLLTPKCLIGYYQEGGKPIDDCERFFYVDDVIGPHWYGTDFSLIGIADSTASLGTDSVQRVVTMLPNGKLRWVSYDSLARVINANIPTTIKWDSVKFKPSGTPDEILSFDINGYIMPVAISSVLAPYISKLEAESLYQVKGSYLLISDTAAMLLPYAKASDVTVAFTAIMDNSEHITDLSNDKLNKSDTAAMLLNYLRKSEAESLYQPKGTYLSSFTELDPTVPSWAKATAKPSYNFSEIGALPTTLAGYGITDFSSVFNTNFTSKSTSDLSEGTNLYFTNARARSAISLTTTGTGSATYNSSTGVLNIPTPPTAKRQETYSGTTNSSGNYTVTFATPHSVAPNIQVTLKGNDVKDVWVTTVSTTGFTVNVQRRADVIGLLPSYSNVNGANVDVLITEK